MPRPSLKNLSKPTPRKYKRIGNILLIIGGGLTTSIMGIPDAALSTEVKIWVVFAVNQITTAGKLFTSMYAEDVEENKELDGKLEG